MMNINSSVSLIGGNKARVRVAFFAEILVPELDGAIRTMYHLIDRIDPGRFEFLFIYGTGPDGIAGFRSIQVPSVPLLINKGYSIALPVLAQNRLNEGLLNFLPDIIHISTPSLLGNFGLNYAMQFNLPVISIYHTHFISYIDYYLKHLPFLISPAREILAQKHKAFYNQCNLVYVPSKSIRTELIEIGIESRRMHLWQRGIDTMLFSPAKKNKATLKKLTGNNYPTILFASRLVWEKNLETLFLIYDELQNSDLQVNILIVGAGSAAAAAKLRMKNAIFTGKTSHKDLAVLYASADIFLFPSVSEAYGNVVLEAMASGLPCVIADGGGSADFIEQGINGFKCQPYDAADYIEKIVLLLGSQILRRQFVDEGLRYSKNFSWNELAATYFDNLEELVNRQSLQLA